MAWPQLVTIQFLYREEEGGLVVEVCHDTIVCIVTGGRLGVTTQHVRGYDTAQQRLATRRRSATTQQRARATRSLYHDTIICILTRGGDDIATCARYTIYDKASERCDTVGHDHDTAPVRATTWLPARGVPAAWAYCSRSVRAAWAMVVGTVHST